MIEGQRDGQGHALVNAAMKTGVGVVVAGLFATAAWLRWRALRSSPYPTGVDGYWYLIQVRSLLEEHRLHYPGPPLVPWLMAALTRLVGPISALKAVAAVGSAAIVIPGYLVAKRIAQATGPALAGAALLATSAQSFYLSTEFVKQGVGLSLAMGFVAALAALVERPGLGRAVIAGLLLLACGLCHSTASGLAVVLTLPLAVASLRPRRAVLVGGSIALVACAAVFFLRPPFAHLFCARADLSFAVLRPHAAPALVLGHEVAWAAILATAALLVAKRKLPALAMGFVAFALFQALPWINVVDDQGLGPRLRLCASICLAPCAALVLERLLRRLRFRNRAVVVSLTIAFIVVLRPWTSAEGVVNAHPAMVEAVSRLPAVVPPGAVVIVPERHVTFMATWYARIDARLRPPPVCGDRCFRLMPGAEIQTDLWAALVELRAAPVTGIAPPIDLHAWHPNGLVLLPEATFQYLLAHLRPTERRWYSDWVVK